VLARERVLEEEAAVWSVALLERRRLNSVWKEAIEERRRSELRRESDCVVVSLEPLLRVGMLLVLGMLAAPNLI